MFIPTNKRFGFTESIVVEEQRQLPRNILQISEMSDDDDLLMSINLDHHVQSSLAATLNHPADLLNDDHDDDLLSADSNAETLKSLQLDEFAESIDYERNDDLTHDDTQSDIITSTEPVKSTVDEYVQPEQIVNIEPDIPAAKPSILDLNYPFKLRGLSLVTIDQLMKIEDYEALRGREFFVKADILNVYEKLRITVDEIWSVGVVLRDSSAEVLKVKVFIPIFVTV